MFIVTSLTNTKSHGNVFFSAREEDAKRVAEVFDEHHSSNWEDPSITEGTLLEALEAADMMAGIYVEQYSKHKEVGDCLRLEGAKKIKYVLEDFLYAARTEDRLNKMENKRNKTACLPSESEIGEP